MFEILTLNSISPVGLDAFDKTRYTITDEAQNPAAVLVRSADMHQWELGSNLKAIARAGAGVNNIPVEKCSEAGVVVFNTPGANANAVKELVMLGLLLSARKVFPAMEWAQGLRGQGDAVPGLVEKGKSKFTGPELQGKRLGVIGLGAIGVAVANLAENFGMEVYGYDPYLSISAAWGLSRTVRHAASLAEIYENCDFITLHVPATAETKGMINAQAIQMMKHGVRILNFARGNLVVDADMLEALEERSVRCYVTDFPNEALLGHPGVLAIPHLGASTPESEDNCARMSALQLMDFLANGNIKNSVNFPDVTMPRSGDVRLAVIHRNIPAMLTGISQAISDAGLNIDNLTNKSKKEYAYTLVDVSGEVNEAVLTRMREVEGVIRVNVYR